MVSAGHRRLHVLVTRPQPAAQATARRLKDLGYEPVVLPLMQAVNDPQAAVLALAQPHAALAITSAQALRVLQDLHDAETVLVTHRQTPIFCVGDATAQAARALGFSRIVVGPGNGEGLAQTILAAAPQSLLYLAGNPRTAAFEARLALAHFHCRVSEVYRMEPLPDIDDRLEVFVTGAAPRAVLLYSRETAKLMAARVGDDPDRWTEIRWLCLSGGIASVLPAGLPHIAIAETPDESSLLRLL